LRTGYRRLLVLGLVLAAVAPAWGRTAGPIPRALGDPASDLVFSPVPPCRIVDTRLAGGSIPGNSQRSFVVGGVTDFETQGGNPGGCAIPEGAAAVVINLVAVGSAGPGDLRAWAFGGPTPGASVLNYAPVSGLNIANGVVVPLCAPGPCAFDLTVQADVSATDLVADVLGFFRPFADGVITTNTATLELRVLGQGAMRLEAGGTDAALGSGPNLVGGFSGNTLIPGVIGATIGGGGASSLVACGGGGPCRNQVTATFGTVGGGGANTASGDGATVAGGQTNTASGPFATVGGGLSNTASGPAATVPGGVQASASLLGQMAYASGAFAVGGDAQTSLFVLRGTTFDGTLTELFLNGSSARITLAPGRTMTFDILYTARSTAGDSAGYQIRGVIENHNGVTALVGAPMLVNLGADAPWSPAVQASDADDALRVLVSGSAGATIRWVAVVRTAEAAQ
jgi:hypothetical protein